MVSFSLRSKTVAVPPLPGVEKEDGMYVVIGIEEEKQLQPVIYSYSQGFFKHATVFTNYDAALWAAKEWLSTSKSENVHILSMKTTITKSTSFTTHRND